LGVFPILIVVTHSKGILLHYGIIISIADTFCEEHLFLFYIFNYCTFAAWLMKLFAALFAIGLAHGSGRAAVWHGTQGSDTPGSDTPRSE
jgi:hypothetical protein